MDDGAAQVSRLRHGIVVEDLNQFTARRLQADVALDGWLFAARDEDFEFVWRIIQRARRGDGGNLRLLRSRGNEHGDARQVVGHGERLGAGGGSSKGKFLQPFSRKVSGSAQCQKDAGQFFTPEILSKHEA